MNKTAIALALLTFSGIAAATDSITYTGTFTAGNSASIPGDSINGSVSANFATPDHVYTTTNDAHLDYTSGATSTINLFSNHATPVVSETATSSAAEWNFYYKVNLTAAEITASGFTHLTPGSYDVFELISTSTPFNDNGSIPEFNNLLNRTTTGNVTSVFAFYPQGTLPTSQATLESGLASATPTAITFETAFKDHGNLTQTGLGYLSSLTFHHVTSTGVTQTLTETSPVPEPAIFWMMASGLVGLVLKSRKQALAA